MAPIIVGSGGTGFEGKSDRIGLPVGTSDPTSPSAGEIYFNSSTNKVRQYNGTAWADLTSSSSGYTKSGLIFDWDPSRLTGFSDGASIANSTSLSTGINTTFTSSGTSIAVNGGSFNYQTEQGGHIDATTNTGRISVTGSNIASALDSCSSMTITCWFQSNSAGRQVLVSRFGTGFPDQFNHIVDPNGDFHYNSSGAIAGTSGNLDTNAWSTNTWALSHWVYSVSDGIARWYVNGSQITTVSFGTDSGSGLAVSGAGAGFAIASRGDDIERLTGRIGPIRIHNIALSASQCSDDWNAERSRFGL